MTQITALRWPAHVRTTQRDQDFADAVLAGLAAPVRTIPARYFYDTVGSELFEQITELPEYYPTRTETGLLRQYADAVAKAVGPNRAVIEFGSGSSVKTPLLLNAISPSAYVPIDISGDFLYQAAAELGRAHPDLHILPLAADFTQRVVLPASIQGRPLMGFFPGSTIGNFTHAGAVNLLRAFRTNLGTDAWLLIGIDTRKESTRLLTAYDDASGVTAAFNLNLLHRINRELDGTIPIDLFAHEVRWNNALGRIEMHLRTLEDVRFRVAGEAFVMQAGETIHTENSYKYTLPEARLLAHASGWDPVHVWTDPEQLFSLHLWRAAAEDLES